MSSESTKMEIDGVPITVDNPTSTDADVLDRDWLKVAFLVSDQEIGDTTDIKNRYYTSASAKFTDTRVGGNIGINPKPQWTRYCDIRAKGRLSGRQDVSISNASGNYGMGDAYSENLDDPAQKIFMRMGVVRYNSLTNFLSQAFNREQTILARTGRAPSTWYRLGKVVGTALAAVSFPALFITIETIRTIDFLVSRPTSKFFTIKPTMYLYWNTVNNLVLNHAVNTGLIKKVFADNVSDGQRVGKPYTIDNEQLQILSTLMPDVFIDGTIDVLAMASKAQRLANQQFEDDYRRLGNDSASDFEGYLKRDLTSDQSHSSYISDKTGAPTIAAMLNRFMSFGSYYTAEQGEDVVQEVDPQVTESGKAPDAGTASKMSEHFNSMRKQLDAEFRDGTDYAIFRVDHTGSIQESFGNSVVESDMSQKINGISSKNAEARFSYADGNLISGVIGDVVGAVKDTAMGVLDGVSLGFSGLIAGLGGSGYIDIPKHWQSSTASLPRGNYTMRLISQYNNPISRLINIWIPFYMVLATGLCRSVGKQAYTSPFYCQIFDRGRLQSRTAMVESISITRGVSNLQFDRMGQALALDLSFTVVDLSSIIHMPVSSGSLFETDMTMDEDNILADYLNVLAGMDIYSQVYTWPKAQLAATKLLAKMKYKAHSPAWQSAMFKNSLQDGFLNDITLGATGLITEALSSTVRGNALIDGTRQ